jgi:uncharacterized repeat protein (TIGR02543 family)
MRKLAIFLTTIALSSVGFATSPANAADEVTCSGGGSFLVSEIGEVFYGASCIGTAIIPENATSIGNNAFRYSGVKTVTFADNSQVLSIGTSAFEVATALERIVLPNSVVSIGTSAFWQTYALKSIAIPVNLTNIAIDAFYISGVTNFQIASGNNFYSSSGGVLFNKNKTTLIRFPPIPTNEYVVPNGVTAISPLAFAYVPFLDAPKLSKIKLPSTLTEIGASAFASTTSLTSIEIPDSVTIIGNYAFAGSGLQSLTLPSGVVSIEDTAFDNSPITKFYFLRSMSAYPSAADPLPFENLTPIAPKIFVPVGAMNYGAIGDTWKGMTVDIGFRATFLGNGSTSGTPPQQIMRGGIDTFLVPGNPGVLKRTGYTFAGWNSAANGKGTSFAADASKAFDGEDLNFYAKWIKNAEATTKPSISGTATSTATGKNKLTAAKGKWTGTPAPTYAYQWYSCSAQVKAVTQTIPASCKAISGATTSKLAVTNKFKNKYLAVVVKGTVAGTPATQWLSKSTGKVK